MTSALFAFASVVEAQVHVTSLAKNVILLRTPHSNLVATVGPEGAIVVGAMDTATTAAVADSLTAHSGSPRRYVLGMAGLASIGQFDAGWDARGALVIIQEFALRRMRRPTSPGLRRPRGEFSQFMSLEMNDEPLHAVRQEPGYANSDVLVHFEGANVVYLGESYAGDGYPRIDASLGGTVEGLLTTLGPWAQPNGSKFVGARGAVASAADIKEFRDMVTAVRDRVRELKAGGRSVDEVVAAKPTAAFDQRYGKGLVTAERFVRDIYAASK
jgi:cyclase